MFREIEKVFFKHGFRNALIPRKVNYYFWVWFDDCYAFFYHLKNKHEIEDGRFTEKWGIHNQVRSRRIDRWAIDFLFSL